MVWRGFFCLAIVAGTFALLSVVVGCDSDRELTQRQFSELVRERVEEEYPNAVISNFDEHGFDYSRGDGERGRLVVTEEYAFYTRNPETLDDVVDRLVSLLETQRHLKAFQETGRIGRAILPVVKPPSFLPEARARANGQPLLYGEHATGLLVFYVVDQPTSISYMTASSLDGLDMTFQQLSALALENLDRRTGEDRFLVASTDDGPIATANTNDGYDAARLLSPSLLVTLSRLLDTASVVVAIPRRDLMLAVPAGEPELIARIQNQARTEFDAGPYSITSDLFFVDRGGVRLMER
jgi:uncharacterized protein YtpQ (UPF0354 family)